MEFVRVIEGFDHLWAVCMSDLILLFIDNLKSVGRILYQMILPTESLFYTI